MGIWAAKFLPFCVDYLPGFPVSHIGFSISYARHFFDVPNVSFNMLLPSLIAPGGKSFLRDAKEKHNRQVYAWTVNEQDKMEWCIRKQLDGVITDDPKKFLEVCKRFDEKSKAPWLPVSFRGYLEVLRVWLWVRIAILLFFGKRLEPKASQKLIRRAAK